MWVTIYTDAGFQKHKNNHGYYAYWAKCNEGHLKGSGVTPSWVTNSIAAETYGLYIACVECVKRWPHLKGILLCCDCVNALDIVKYGSDRIVTGELDYMQSQMKRLNSLLKIRTKWVRGHQLDDSVESYLNRYCDRAAAIHKKTNKKYNKKKRR